MILIWLNCGSPVSLPPVFVLTQVLGRARLEVQTVDLLILQEKENKVIVAVWFQFSVDSSQIKHSSLGDSFWLIVINP